MIHGSSIEGNMDKKDFRHGEFGEPPIDARKPLLINGLRMSMAREGVLREGCKPSTIRGL